MCLEIDITQSFRKMSVNMAVWAHTNRTALVWLGFYLFSCRRCVRWLKVTSLFVFVVVCSVSTTELCCWVSRAPGCLGLDSKAPKVWGSYLSLEEMLKACGLWAGVGEGGLPLAVLLCCDTVETLLCRRQLASSLGLTFHLKASYQLFSTTSNGSLYLSWACPASWVAPRMCLAVSICVVCILM